MAIGVERVGERVPEVVLVEEAVQDLVEKALHIPEIAEVKQKAEEAIQSLHYSPRPRLISEGTWEGFAMSFSLRCSVAIGSDSDQLKIETVWRMEREVLAAFSAVGLRVYKDTAAVYQDVPGQNSMTFIVLSGEVQEVGSELKFASD